jgi:AbrB family looped-hinge helix DNA binding protein
MRERPVLPLLPPTLHHRQVRRHAASSAGSGTEHCELLAVSRLDHSGRVGDHVLLTALGWLPGDRHDVRRAPHGAELYRSLAGRFRIDSRGNVFVPAGTRKLLGLRSGDRVVLVASPSTGTLHIHPVGIVTALLANLYRQSPGDPDAE